ncbi:hypothetical protein CLV88_115108 [Shimia abyssi]|uniref:Uncharacterized protein n=1 Tax=Shimia abyssi TaxID=1662395 RepID=A0A2P8F7R3_9RHOB|nr:hypothetical protein CLV88_115108 [Shimia abyssi]
MPFDIEHARTQYLASDAAFFRFSAAYIAFLIVQGVEGAWSSMNLSCSYVSNTTQRSRKQTAIGPSF